MLIRAAAILPLLLASTGCFGQTAETLPREPAIDLAEAPFAVTPVTELSEPWAMTFLPDGRLLVTDKAGTLHIVTRDGAVSDPVSGVPEVAYGGQGGLGDVVLHPDFAQNNIVYLTYAEPGDGNTRGAAMGRGTLDPESDEQALADFEVIWRQEPKVTGRGHYGHRIAFSPDGQYLFLTSGDRQKLEPAQDLSNNLGTVLRLTPDGEPAAGNPFADQGGVTAEIWSYGHRNPLGLAFDTEGVLWEHEMGPRGGDEFQKIERGGNYGWPTVSNGIHYSGGNIPNHPTRPEFRAPDDFWTPVIAPAGLIIYSGSQFPDWQGSALIGGLASQALIRVTFDCPVPGQDICEAERFDMGARIREVEQGPDGHVWLLEDGGRLLKLSPR